MPTSPWMDNLPAGKAVTPVDTGSQADAMRGDRDTFDRHATTTGPQGQAGRHACDKLLASGPGMVDYGYSTLHEGRRNGACRTGSNTSSGNTISHVSQRIRSRYSGSPSSRLRTTTAATRAAMQVMPLGGR